jgi:chorismate mutase
MPDSSDPTLDDLRASIDNIDAALVHLLAERFKITKAVGAHKKSVGLPPADPGREQEQIARLRELAEAAGLDPTFSDRPAR